MSEYEKTYTRLEILEKEIKINKLQCENAQNEVNIAANNYKIGKIKGLDDKELLALDNVIKEKQLALEKVLSVLSSNQQWYGECEGYIAELHSMDGGDL